MCVMSLYKGGLVITGPDGTVQFFKKTLNEWIPNWKLKPIDPLILQHCYAQEFLVGIDQNGTIFSLNDDGNETVNLSTVREYDR